jgi:hypothetical protein
MNQIGFSQVKKKKKSVYPNEYRCELLANGVVCNENFYPFRKFNASTTGATIPAKVKTRIFLRSANLSVRQTGIMALGAAALFAWVDGTEETVCNIRTPQMTLADDFFSFTQDFNIWLLCDEYTPVTTSLTTTSANFNVVYAYVDIAEKKPLVK